MVSDEEFLIVIIDLVCTLIVGFFVVLDVRFGIYFSFYQVGTNFQKNWIYT